MVLLRSFVVAGLSAAVAAKSAVIDLIPGNFDDVVLKSGKPTLVEFFAPWCGHCKNLAPVYEELATAFEYAKDKVQIAKVDADAEKSLGSRFGIQGFPTLKWFDGVSDKPSDYTGGRDLDALSSFITDQTGVRAKRKNAAPSNIAILTDRTFKEVVNGDKNVLVAFTAPWCGHCKSLAPVWETIAENYANEPNVVIAKVDAEADNSKATASKFGVTSYPTIKFFPKGTTEGEDYDGGRIEEDFVEFLNLKTGTKRAVGGGLDETAGLVEVLDDIVAKYTTGTSLSEAAAEAKKAVESLKDAAEKKYSEYYIRVFDKLIKNEKFADKELARLEGLIKKGGLLSTKFDDFTIKTNVLRKFTDKVTEETGKDEL